MGSKGSGISILQDLRAARVPAFSYNPGKADKTSRLMQVLPLLNIELVYVLESRREPGKPVTWVRDAIKQWTTFPAAAHEIHRAFIRHCSLKPNHLDAAGRRSRARARITTDRG